MLREQGADVVTAEHAPAVRAAGYADRAPVRVRVVGHDEVGADLEGERHRQVHRTRLLGVGEGHRREVGIGLGLGGDQVGLGEACALERGGHGGAADAVQRGVDDGEVAGALAGEVDHAPQVAVEHLVAQGLAPVTAGDVGKAPTAAICSAMSASVGATIWLPSPR